MRELPWWALSPSPWTVAFWIVCALYGYRKLEGIEYVRIPKLARFVDAALVLGFVVMLGDLFWVLLCWAKFGSLFPGSVEQLLWSAARDGVAVLFCLLGMARPLEAGLLSFKNTELPWLINALFICVWFLLAPNPSWTDWTFAWRHGLPMARVIQAFFLSHIVGKGLTALIYWRFWK